MKQVLYTATAWSSRFRLRFITTISACLLVTANTGLSQVTEKQFIDEFNDASKIITSSNVTIENGEVSLLNIDSTLTTSASFSIFLEGVESRYNGPEQVEKVVDIDQDSDEPTLFYISDAGRDRVFFFDSNNPGQPGTGINLDFTPSDICPYLENNRRMVLICGTDPGTQAGRLVKVDFGAVPRIIWDNRDINLTLEQPADVMTMTGVPNEIIVSEAGKNRLIAIDTTQTNAADAMTILVGDAEAQFDSPIDIERVPEAGNILYLVTDRDNDRVVIVQRDGNNLTTIWQFGGLMGPSDADALPNGEVLICDAGNNRLISVNRQFEITFQFAAPLPQLTDADRLVGGRSVVASQDSDNPNRITTRTLAYTSGTALTDIFTFGRPVDYDTLEWDGLRPDSTDIRLRLRSANSRASLLTANFRGPSPSVPFYTDTISEINPIHDGDSLFQFQVFLDTSSPFKTPTLTSIKVTSHFIRFETPGIVLSEVIRDTANHVITNWVSLGFPNRGIGITVDILDPNNGNLLLASFRESEEPITSLSTAAPAVVGKQSLRLRATLRTTDPFLTENSPILESWRLVYESTPLMNSQISFTDASFTPITIYRTEGMPGDSVFVSLLDPSLAQSLSPGDSVDVELRSALTGDTETLSLGMNMFSTIEFRGGMPFALKADTLANDTLAVQERDTIFVSYIDPFDASDQSSDSARIFQVTRAEIQIEDADGVPLDTMQVGDSFFVRVTNEGDRNISPTLQDTISVLVFVDRDNGEFEQITLLESPDEEGDFDSGVFLSEQAIQAVLPRTEANDNQLRAREGDEIVARYIDPFDPEPRMPVDAVVLVLDTSGTITPFVEGAFKLTIAPNPYRTRVHTQLNLRGQVANGSMTLRKIEVYNLAGERVASIPENRIAFRTSNNNQIDSADGPVDAMNWWSLRTDLGSIAPSGTYFVKFYVDLTDGSSTDIQKLVIIQ